ncbi:MULTISPECIES: hypothetical protein [Arthrobacter]|nr:MULTISPECIES: hypothetical protein [Arthrobacter]
MTMSELWPQIRPLCRRLALLGWISSVAGMSAGLAVAIAGGTSLSPLMSALQLGAVACLAITVVSFIAAAALTRRLDSAPLRDAVADPDAGDLTATMRNLLFGSVALLAGAIAFACAGLILRNGPSAQSVAFCQVFLLGAAASGFTYMIFSKTTPPHGADGRDPVPPVSRPAKP